MKHIFLLITTLLFSYMAHSQKLTEKEQQRFDNLMKEGDLLVDAGKLKQSIVAFTEALKIDPNAANALLSRGMVYFEEKDFTNALPDFTKLIELDTEKKDEAYFMRGLIKTQLKDPEADGCADLKKAQELRYSYDWDVLRKMCPNL